MDRGIRFFWTVVVGLLAASLFFGVSAERRRRAVQSAATAEVHTGDLLSLVQAQDGDTALLADAAGRAVTVRLIGVKAFGAGAGREVAPFAREAVGALERALAGKPIRAMLASPAKDRHGRTLATLFVDDADVAVGLLRDGRLLAYTQYPFPAMGEYLAAQAAARAGKRGLWADPLVAERARALGEQWKSEAP